MQSQIEILQQLEAVKKRHYTVGNALNSGLSCSVEYWLEAIARGLFKGEPLQVESSTFHVEGLPLSSPPFEVKAGVKTIKATSKTELWCKVIANWEEINQQKLKQAEHEFDYGY